MAEISVQPIVKASGLSKSVSNGAETLAILQHIELQVMPGEGSARA